MAGTKWRISKRGRHLTLFSHLPILARTIPPTRFLARAHPSMKSEHRHELKTNELGRLTSDFRRTSERYVHEHRNTALAVAAAVAIGVVGLLFWMNRLGSIEREGWRAVAAAGKGAD